MSCTRCGGLMQCERVHWRSRLILLACMACGDRTDETILAHRRWMARQDTHSWKTRTWARIQHLAAQEEVSACR